MSQVDSKWARTLNLNANERIVKIGKTVVHSYTQGGKISTPGKFVRKILGIKKERTLILTNEGRAFMVAENHDETPPDLGDLGKIKGLIPLDKFSITTLEDESNGRIWSVETVHRASIGLTLGTNEVRFGRSRSTSREMGPGIPTNNGRSS
jgi:hypothetical protein